jgi:hypothetical protein
MGYNPYLCAQSKINEIVLSKRQNNLIHSYSLSKRQNNRIHFRLCAQTRVKPHIFYQFANMYNDNF